LNLEETVEFAFSCSLPIRPIQKKAEILRLLEIVEKQSPKSVLEIGTQNGGTLYLLCQTANPSATIISVDLPDGPFGGGYPEWRGQLYTSFFPRDNQTLHLIRADSHKPETLRQVQAILNDQKLDVLFIDGDHTYEGVKKDFKMYSPLVAKGA
jgi:cephalosporin hydroxylase